MRTISLLQAQAGMELARDLLDPEGNLLLEKGIRLTDRYIKRLHLLGIPAIYVIDPLLEDLSDTYLIPEGLRRETLACLSELFQSQVSDILGSFRKRELQIRRLNRSICRIVSEVIERSEDLLNLNIYHLGDSVVNHSLNVCLLSIIIGLRANLSPTGLNELALGALLHDIGKLCIPESILSKAGPLTQSEMDLVRKHPLYGYELIRLSDEISPASALTVLHHHERFDGSGYSQGLSGEDIHLYGRICAIADVFEAMTADRIYRPALPRQEAIETMLVTAPQDFDLHHLNLFLQNIAVYPIGSKVRLHTGEEGYVVKNHPQTPLRPIVRIITDPYGQPLHAAHELNLANHSEMVLSNCK